jgi:hypothetical protein
VILKAPISSGYSEKAIQLAKAKFPGVPIKAIFAAPRSFSPVSLKELTKPSGTVLVRTGTDIDYVARVRVISFDAVVRVPKRQDQSPRAASSTHSSE